MKTPQRGDLIPQKGRHTMSTMIGHDDYSYTRTPEWQAAQAEVDRLQLRWEALNEAAQREWDAYSAAMKARDALMPEQEKQARAERQAAYREKHDWETYQRLAAVYGTDPPPAGPTPDPGNGPDRSIFPAPVAG